MGTINLSQQLQLQELALQTWGSVCFVLTFKHCVKCHYVTENKSVCIKCRVMFSFVFSLCFASKGRKTHYKSVFIMLSCKVPASCKSCMYLHFVNLETEVWNEWTCLRWGSKLVLQMGVFKITLKKTLARIWAKVRFVSFKSLQNPFSFILHSRVTMTADSHREDKDTAHLGYCELG